MKKKLLMLALIILVFIAMLVPPVFMFESIVKRPLIGEAETISINANKGTFSGILAENGDVFRGTLFIKLYNRINKVSISVKKGKYEFPSNITLEELIKSLEEGKYNTSIVKVTIPEGYTIEKIADTLEKNEVITKEEFLKGCLEYDLPSYITKNNKRRYDLEGYLFPDTYILEKGMSAEKIISIMLNRFEEILNQIQKDNDLVLKDDDIERMVIKASIIEREVSKLDEKALVSSVIDNRLAINMKLQIDATVLYSLGKHKDKLLYKDLEYPSLYNTYYIEGLPVGAISNPGKDSLVAAVLPEETDYIYYMTKDGTNHKFFKTYKEFLKYKNGKGL